MTSIIGLKLSSQLSAWLGRQLEDVLVWNHGTLRALVDYAARPEAPADPLENLADEDVARLLEAELGDSGPR